MKEYETFRAVLRKKLNEILQEEFIKKNSLMHTLRGEILELEYKGDPQVIQDLIDSLESRIGSLEVDLAAEKVKTIQLQTDKTNLSDRITALEPEPEPEP